MFTALFILFLHLHLVWLLFTTDALCEKTSVSLRVIFCGGENARETRSSLLVAQKAINGGGKIKVACCSLPQRKY